jgi:hypothetical protein
VGRELILAVALATVTRGAWAQAPFVPGLAHAEIRDTSVDALPHVSIPVSPDLVLAVVDVGTTDVGFKLRFRPGSFDPSTTRLTIELDIDQNAATGVAGVEYQVRVFPAGGRGADIVRTVKGTETVAGNVPVNSVDDGCDVSIPRRLLGDDDGRFDFRVRVFAEPAPTIVIDLLPDIGMVRVQ